MSGTPGEGVEDAEVTVEGLTALLGQWIARADGYLARAEEAEASLEQVLNALHEEYELRRAAEAKVTALGQGYREIRKLGMEHGWPELTAILDEALAALDRQEP